MKKINLLSVLIFLLSFSVHSQEPNAKTILGFACWGSGSSTKSVNKVYHYITENKYDKITKLLYSKNPAEKFLAVFVCEKLAAKSKIKLTQKDLNTIKKIYNSDELVSVCSGCTFQGNIKMSILLQANQDIEYIKDEAENYFKDIL